MKVVEIISEATAATDPIPDVNSEEFQASKQSFVKFINQAIVDYSKTLNDMQKSLPQKYKEMDREEIANGFKDAIWNLFKSKSNGNLTDADKPYLKWDNFIIKSGTRSPQTQATQATSTANAQPQTQNTTTAQPQTTPTESLLPEAQFIAKGNTVKLTPKEIDVLATRATQVWYKNRKLKTDNPKLYAQHTGDSGGYSGARTSSSAASSSSPVLNAIGQRLKVDPNSKEFAAKLAQVLSQPDDPLKNPIINDLKRLAGIA
jgi:hypothetical protein